MSASAPIRLDIELVNSASAEGGRQRRSTPKQIEYWADLGRAVDGLVSEAELVALRAGLLRLESVPSAPVDADQVFAAVSADRQHLAQELRHGGVAYQASRERPGYLEATYPDGQVVIGQFREGIFEPALA